MITFISKDSSKTLLIGGQGTMAGANAGLVGPVPRYSINREEIATGDGTYVGTKFNVTITGTAAIKTTDSQDMLTAGQRQMRVQGEAIIAMQFNRDEFPMFGGGKLTIAGYGGSNNKIEFNDARIISVELPEQNEETAGVQNLEYSFTFEAYKDNSSSANTGATDAPQQPEYKLASAEESWDLSLNDGQMVFQNSEIDGNTPYKTWTLTHTVSATGLKKFSTGAGLDTDGEAWRQATKYVGSRLVDDPKNAIVTDIMNNSDIVTEFGPFYMDKEGDSSNLKYNLSSDYKAYNHVRQVQNDQAAGSCSVTDTWVISELNQPVSHDIEISLEADPEAKGNTITVSGTIQGLSSNGIDTNTDDKYTNALSALSTVLGKAYDAANAVYTSSGLTKGLVNRQKQKSVGHGKSSGTITFSVTFDDIPVTTDGAVKEEVNLTYDNWDLENKVVAIIGVIDNAGGPVIQDMGTTTEKKLNVSVDITMDQDNRTTRPDGTPLALLYISTDIVDTFRQTKTESWNPFTGVYNLSLSFVGTGST